MFIVGGVMPFALAVLLAIAMPESLAFLSTQAAISRRCGRSRCGSRRRSPPTPICILSADDKLPGVPLKHLFTEGRAAGTILLWIVFFLSFFLIIWFVSWVRPSCA